MSEFERVTADQLKETMMKTGVASAIANQCVICRASLYFVRLQDQIYFDSSCDCTTFQSPLRQHTWEDAASFINGFEDNEIKKRFGFGFDQPPLVRSETCYQVVAVDAHFHQGYSQHFDSMKELEEWLRHFVINQTEPLKRYEIIEKKSFRLIETTQKVVLPSEWFRVLGLIEMPENLVEAEMVYGALVKNPLIAADFKDDLDEAIQSAREHFNE